ncbi:serine protease [Methylacidimicrobium sp. B4]|uniref:S1 family peptidase n=1 Tax=Methylacidimicrobium sp. B4 TaxID=2796139 RepID=UPI001A8D2AD3|nr:serine protease [Methylacidimicrobium sp. B4]QSR84311.1 trypsin-like peptidase domain-containing protein [Methylacidimicrobium sp. B4]
MVLVAVVLPVTGRADGIRLDRDNPASEAIVQVVAYQGIGNGIVRVTGTGFFVNPHGQLITNRHLLSRAVFCAVLGPGTEPLRVDRVLAEAGDLVLVQVDLPTGAKAEALQLRKTPPIRGEAIRIEGYPLGVGLASASGRVVGFRHKPYHGALSFEVDAPTFSGNSGGPVVDEVGRVVGVTTFRSLQGTNRLAGALCPRVLMDESRIVDLPFPVWSRRTGNGRGAVGPAANGWRALQCGDLQSARLFFRTALRSQTRGALLHQGLAEALLESGRPQEAALSLSAAIEERPKDFLARLRLAAVYRRLGKPELAALEEAAGRRIEGSIFSRIETEVAAREQTGLPGLWEKARFILQRPVESGELR